MTGEHDNVAFETDQPLAVITRDESNMKYETFKPARLRKRRVNIQRPVYTEKDINRLYGQETESASLWKKIKVNFKETCTCSQLLQRFLSFFPIISWLPHYKKHYILRDLSAGLTLGVMQIPQGMAYGMLTTLPAIFGLYVSLVPVLVYFIMGSSKHLSIGTFAIISLMVGEVIEKNINQNLPVANRNLNSTLEYDQEVINLRVEYAVTVSFLVGAMQAVLGLFRVGFITIFLSDPLVSGFTTGAAFHVFSSQVKHLVGMSIPRKEVDGFFSLFKLYIYIFKNITDTKVGSLVIGIVATIILLVVKYLTQKYQNKIKVPIPAELIVVVLGTGLSYGFQFKQRFSIPILESVPKGLPPISMPMFGEMSGMIVDCASIAIVSYAISISVAKAFAKKNKYTVDADQELYAHGAANMVGSFFSCFVASASLSRSVLQEDLGSTQMAGFLSSILIVLTLTVLAPLFRFLPKAILAAIVLVALKGLFRQFSVFKALLKISCIDAFIWIVSFGCVMLFGVDYGLAFGLAVNLLAAIVRNSRPTYSIMGHVKETEIYLDKEENTLTDITGVSIFQFHAPLFFANVEYFQITLYERTVDPTNCIVMTVPLCYQKFDMRNELDDETNEFYISNGKLDIKSRSGTMVIPTKIRHKIKRSGSFDSPYSSDLKTLRTPDRREFCPLHTIIIDCSQICYADTMGIGTLVSVCSEYRNVGVNVYLTNCPVKLLHSLHRGGFVENHGAENIFVTIHDAVQYSLSQHHLKGICDPTMKENFKEYVVIANDVDSSSTAQSCQENGENSSNIAMCDIEKV